MSFKNKINDGIDAVDNDKAWGIRHIKVLVLVKQG